MKSKILALGFLSLCTMAFFTEQSQAWLLNHFHHHKYVTHITCRPYNAFTPICWGNLVCDGCCPSFGGGGGCQMPMMMGAPYACGYGSCGANGCGPTTSTPPITNFTPPMPMPTGPNTTYFPMPIPNSTYYPPIPTVPNTTYYSTPENVSQATFYPQGYYPQTYYPGMPTYFNPNAGYYPAPNYWYGR